MRSICVAIFTFLTTTVAIAEDWPMARHDPQRSGFTSETLKVASLRESWTHRSAHPPAMAWTAPARWDAYAHIRGLRAMRDYDAAFQPIVVKGSVYYGSSVDDSIHCIDLKSGKEKWVFTTDGPVRIAPTFFGSHLYFGSDDGHAYCITAREGKLVWKYRPPSEKRRVLHNGRFISLAPCRTGVVVHNGNAYCAFSLLPWRKSYLCSLDRKTGKPQGEGCYLRTLSSGFTLEGALAIQGETIIVSQGRVPPAVFGKKDGMPLGSLGNGGGSFLTGLGDNQVAHGPGNKTGWVSVSSLKTRKPIATYQKYTSVIKGPRAMYLLGDERLAAMAPGQRTFHREVTCPCSFEMVVAGNAIVAGGDDVVVAFDTAQGKEIWRGKVQGRARGLVVANGSLLVSTDEGALHCFQPGSGKAAPPTRPKQQPSRPRAVLPTKVKDKDLLSHWVVHSGMSDWAKRRGLPNGNRMVRDLTGAHHGLIVGQKALRRVGSVEAFVLDGSTVISITDDHRKLSLPTKAISVSTWARVDKPLDWGCVLGAIQDNGSFERGWLLGFRGQKFCFAVAAKGGPDRLNYMTAPGDFTLGEWHHLVGTYDGKTQKLYVNGKLAVSSTEQKGEIHYPPQAFMELGAYRDKDEYFKMTGQLHEARIYRRALAQEEVSKQYQSKARQFPRPIRLPVGPYAYFVDKSTAVIQWQTEKPSPTVLTYGTGDPDHEIRSDKPARQHKVVVKGLRRNRIYHYRIQTTEAKQVGSTPRFELDTHFNYTVGALSSDIDPYKQVKHASLCKETAKRILEQHQAQKGICLVLDCVDGCLAYEMARQSEMRVIVVSEDRARAEKLRGIFLKSGAYGQRIAVHRVASLSELPFTGHFANLVVSERMLLEGTIRGSSKEVHRILRPRGMALLGRPQSNNGFTAEQLRTWAGQAEGEVEVSTAKHGIWATVRKGMPLGSGEWSHLYGSPDNSAFGGEALGGARSIEDLQVQWLGKPGPRAQPDRSGRKPSPLSTGGRLFVQGLHRIIALDAYNGTLLWQLSIPPLERFNMPRDCGNWCADDRYLYVAIRSHCWQIDAQTGKVIKRHKVTPGPREEWKHDWSFLARTGNSLLGSAVKQGTGFTNFWGNANQGWYDARSGPATWKVCSENLFSRDAKRGGIRWTYARGLIINPTITIAKDRIYFVECRHPKVIASASRRVGMPELWQNQFLVCLDLVTGKQIYERAIDTENGTVVFYLAHGNGKLILCSSTNQRYHVYAMEAESGKQLWHQQFGWPGGKGDHGKAMSRPAIVGKKVYVRPGVMSLETGKLLSLKMPLGGCGTYAATENLFIFRNGNVTVWDADKNKVSSWGRLRPGCWLSTIPAGGMLLSPEAGGGCSCGNWMETSIGFIPKRLKTGR